LRPTGGIVLSLAVILVVAPAAPAYTPPPLFRGNPNIQPHEVCKDCHLDITEQWKRSAHSKADRSKNLLFGRMYFQSLKVTRGGTMLACGPCHETVAFVNQDFNVLRSVTTEGVTCSYCHAVAGPGVPQGVPPYTLDVSNYYGTIRNPTYNNTHGSAYTQYLATSDYCGACHDYKNQNGVPISTTYAEWKKSKYAKQGVTCQSCHMPGGPGRNSYLGPARPRVANHAFDREMLLTARPGSSPGLTLRAQRVRTGDSLRVFATVANKGWGHSLPTGNDQKMALVRLRVLSGSGAVVWENDPFGEWNVSIFGVILADELGTWPAETWTAASVLSDRRIKAGGSAVCRYDVPIGDNKGPFTIEAQLTHRRARPTTLTAYDLDEEIYGAERVLAETTLKVP
jgi:hypothetical protein